MIEISSSTGNLEEVGHDPYDTPVDYMTQIMVDRYDHMIGLLERLTNFSERQREKASPEVVDLSPASGSPVSNTYSTKTRLRVERIIITGAAGDQIRITVGVRPYNFFASGSYEFPILIDRGIDLAASDITNPLAVAWSCYVIGYPE